MCTARMSLQGSTSLQSNFTWTGSSPSTILGIRKLDTGLPDSEDRTPQRSFVLTQYRTERRTDRQTDRFAAALALKFPKVAAATANMTDSSRYEYHWRRRLSHVNMTDFDLTKYDWRRRLGSGGSGDYTGP